jgi:hypothetical protein
MRFDIGIHRRYRRSVDDALAAILEHGNEFHREMVNAIVDSRMLIRVQPVKELNASGVTHLISPVRTNLRLATERFDFRDALGEICISIAEETIDTGGQRGCEGTFVHEGRHAYDFARTLDSLSNRDMNPIGVFDPTLYELEWEAHKTAGDYMILINRKEYLDEGLQLMILGLGADGSCFVSGHGIKQRLRDNYGLSLDGDQGKTASRMMGIVI